LAPGWPTIVATNPKVDIDNVVRIGNGQRVIGYTYADDRRHTVYLDPEYKALSAALGKALPNLPIVTFVSASADGTRSCCSPGAIMTRVVTSCSTRPPKRWAKSSPRAPAWRAGLWRASGR